MCGIAGSFGFSERSERREEAVARMVGALCHRGPDDAGVCELRGPGGERLGSFGHRRLAILDLSPQGHQPMLDSSGRFSIVFNGEIYNYLELKRALAADGAVFRSGSDTEVLLEGWAREGEAFLPRLRGMFAFALWDASASVGYLVRDRFGIKPLYVAETGDGLLFASEVRSLAATGLVNRALDPRAVAAYLANGAVPEPLSMLRDVRMLPAGSVVRVRTEQGRHRADTPRIFARALSPAPSSLDTDPVRAAAAVRAALADSVRHHMVSDVPVSLFLSGGIDSSAVTALARESTDAPLHTFTITFSERRYDEAGPAAAVARKFGTSHEQVPLSGDELLASLPAALASMDQPSLDGLNTYAVSAAVRRAGYKVVLSGLGGDEMFAGYPSFRRAARIAPLWTLGAAPRRLLGALASRAGRGGDGRAGKVALALAQEDAARAGYLGSRAVFSEATVERLVGRVAAESAASLAPEDPPDGLTTLQRVSWYELTGYMRNILLRDSDVFSMAHGLELRVPFVDDAVAAASMAADDSLKLSGDRSKPLLVQALGELLPREVWDRPKQGFELPFATWLRAQLKGEVGDALTSPRRLARVGVDAAAARAVWEAFLQGRGGVSWSRPWALFTLLRWAEENDFAVDSAPRVADSTMSASAEPGGPALGLATR